MTIRSWLRPRLNATEDFFMLVIGMSFIIMIFFIPACIYYLGAWWNEEPITFMDAVREIAIV